jgi:iron(II)-dependent oxidoreductase
MIGNVWEWNQDDFATWQSESGWDFEGNALKSIRGGAFDTYLDSQAACRSQSGEEAFARRHNVGFRCVADPGQLVSQD